MATPYDVLLTGDVLAAVLQVYTDVLGFWVYVIGLGALLAGVYFKSKNTTAVGIIGLLFASAMTSANLLPPEAAVVLQVIIVFAIVGVLYEAFKKVR